MIKEYDPMEDLNPFDGPPATCPLSYSSVRDRYLYVYWERLADGEPIVGCRVYLR